MAEAKESKGRDVECEETVLKEQDVLRHLNMFYTKFMNYREMENDVIPVSMNLSLVEYFVNYLFARYEAKDLVLKKFKDILASVLCLYPSDPRIMQFAVFLGLTNVSFTPEEIFIHAKLLKVSQIPPDTIFGNKHNVFIKYDDARQMLKKYALPLMP